MAAAVRASLVTRAAHSRSVASRAWKWELYARVFPPRLGERVLDVGVSRYADLPGTNHFVRAYPYPEQLTCVGLDEIPDFEERYPGAAYVRADGRSLPFADGAFDVVHSNAVVEHVGPLADQRRFVSELVRVARAGFVTTPNRWFPVETHSHLPLLHWLPRPALVASMRRLHHDDWPVWLLDPRSFRRLFPPGLELELHRSRIGGLPATLVAVFRAPDRT